MKNKVILYSSLFIVGLLVFILAIFVFQKPDGIFGLLLCLFSIYLTLSSVIKLCKISPKFKDTFLASLDILFWLP